MNAEKSNTKNVSLTPEDESNVNEINDNRHEIKQKRMKS